MLGQVFRLFLILLGSMMIDARPIESEGCRGAVKEGHYCPCYMPIISAVVGSVINMTLGSCMAYLLTRILKRYLGDDEGHQGQPRSNHQARRRGWTKLVWKRNR